MQKQLSKNGNENVWKFKEAKANLSQVLDLVQEKGIQTIVRNRNEVYIVLSKEKYDEFIRPKGSLIDFFMNAPCSDVELDLTRSQVGIRELE